MQISALHMNSRESYRFSLIWTNTNLPQMINRKESVAKREFPKRWGLYTSHYNVLGTQRYLDIHVYWGYRYTQGNTLMDKNRDK